PDGSGRSSPRAMLTTKTTESRKRVMVQPPYESSGHSKDAVKYISKICATGGQHTSGGAQPRRVAAPERGSIWRPLTSTVRGGCALPAPQHPRAPWRHLCQRPRETGDAWRSVARE